MVPEEKYVPIPIGTFVKIRNSGFPQAIVSEYRGPLGPRGARVYGLHVGPEADANYIEVLEEQLEILPDVKWWPESMLSR